MHTSRALSACLLCSCAFLVAEAKHSLAIAFGDPGTYALSSTHTDPSRVTVQRTIPGTDADPMEAFESLLDAGSAHRESYYPIAMTVRRSLLQSSQHSGSVVNSLYIPVPAPFTSSERKALLDIIAHEKVDVSFISESVAIALAEISLGTVKLLEGFPTNILVINLGDFSTDLSLLQYNFGTLEVRAVEVSKIGGRSVDRKLMNLFMKYGGVPDRLTPKQQSAVLRNISLAKRDIFKNRNTQYFTFDDQTRLLSASDFDASEVVGAIRELYQRLSQRIGGVESEIDVVLASGVLALHADVRAFLATIHKHVLYAGDDASVKGAAIWDGASGVQVSGPVKQVMDLLSVPYTFTCGKESVLLSGYGDGAYVLPQLPIMTTLELTNDLDSQTYFMCQISSDDRVTHGLTIGPVRRGVPGSSHVRVTLSLDSNGVLAAKAIDRGEAVACRWDAIPTQNGGADTAVQPGWRDRLRVALGNDEALWKAKNEVYLVIATLYTVCPATGSISRECVRLIPFHKACSKVSIERIEKLEIVNSILIELAEQFASITQEDDTFTLAIEKQLKSSLTRLSLPFPQQRETCEKVVRVATKEPAATDALSEDPSRKLRSRGVILLSSCLWAVAIIMIARLVVVAVQSSRTSLGSHSAPRREVLNKLELNTKVSSEVQLSSSPLSPTATDAKPSSPLRGPEGSIGKQMDDYCIIEG